MSVERMLIIDHNLENVQKIKEIFPDNETSIFWAKSGFEAEQIISKEKSFDVIISNATTPGEGNLDFCRKYNPRFPLVLITNGEAEAFLNKLGDLCESCIDHNDLDLRLYRAAEMAIKRFRQDHNLDLEETIAA